MGQLLDDLKLAQVLLVALIVRARWYDRGSDAGAARRHLPLRAPPREDAPHRLAPLAHRAPRRRLAHEGEEAGGGRQRGGKRVELGARRKRRDAAGCCRGERTGGRVGGV